MNLKNYLRYRKYIEPILWALLLLLVYCGNIFVIAIDFQRSGNTLPLWHPAVWEASSLIVVALLLPLILVFDTHFPLSWKRFPRCIWQHAVFSVVFSLTHVILMVAIRKWVYALMGTYYDFGPIVKEWFYEYSKDVQTYALLLGIINLYRFILLRLQGEVSMLDAEEEGLNTEQNENVRRLENFHQQHPPERLLVKKLGKEFLIRTEDIEYAEAAGNYVNLHIAGRQYPLRITMTKLAERLEGKIFKRIHRSWLVNVNQVHSLQALDSGDAQLRLNSGVNLPVSRNYRRFLENI